MKKSYREKNWYAKDKEYKQRTRKLEIWSYIAFLNPVYIDWAPRENVWEVVGYQLKKRISAEECAYRSMQNPWYQR